jgi:hypothetical protein
VARLYRDFQADGNNPARSFVDQPRAILAAYLDPSLTDLVASEGACVARRHAVCGLHFALLWGSQEPDAHDVTLRRTSDPAVVIVGLGGSEGSRYIEITYRLVKTGIGWRVHDVVYPHRASLRALLSRQAAR